MSVEYIHASLPEKIACASGGPVSNARTTSADRLHDAAAKSAFRSASHAARDVCGEKKQPPCQLLRVNGLLRYTYSAVQEIRSAKRSREIRRCFSRLI